MKKRLLLAFTLLMAVTTLFAERVSEEDAALVANNFMSASVSASGAKRTSTKMVLKKSAKAASESQFYVYENPDGGWVMVAASNVAHPVLAYSLTGQFRMDNQPENLKAVLNGYERQIKRAEADGLEASAKIAAEWTAARSGLLTAGTPVVEPLIQTGWDQGDPYWNLCPKKNGNTCPVGCTATALAQVMNYWQWPKQGTDSRDVAFNDGTNDITLSANFGATEYDWDNMLDTYGKNATAAQKLAVATLMYHCGIACDMEYDEGGSGAYLIDYDGYWSGQGIMSAEAALTRFFGYKASTVKGKDRDECCTSEEWVAMLEAELKASRPVLYAGYGFTDPDDEDTAYGHSFVCDGYDNQDYFHFNFGWSNWGDGYYDIDAVEPTDPGTGGGNGNYSSWQQAVIGIIPDKPQSAVESITIEPASVTLKQNESKKLVAKVLPTDAMQSVIWVSGNSAVVSVTDGKIKGLKQGTATIYAKATDDSGIQGTCQVTVTDEVIVVPECEAYSFEYTSKKGAGTQTLGGVSWVIELEAGEVQSFDGTRGEHFGSNNTPAKSVTYTTSDFEECTISDVVIEASAGASGTLEVFIDEISLGSQSLTSKNAEFTFTNTNDAQGEVKFVLTAATKALYVKSIAVNKNGGTTPTTVYVTWSNSGVAGTPVAYTSGASLVLPEEPTCDGKTFVGWTESSQISGKPADLFKEAGDKKVTKDVTYYAVFATLDGGGSKSSSDITLTAGTDTSDELKLTKDGVTIEMSNGVLNRTDNYRCYANGTMTVSSASTITKIVLNCNASGTSKGGPGCFTADGYSYDAKVGTWEGEATSVVFTAGQQVQINSMVVTLSGTAASYKDYTLVCGSAPEEVMLEPTVAEVTLYPNESSNGNYKWIIKVADGPISGTHSFLMTVGFYTSANNAIAGTFSGNSIISGQLEYNGQISSTAVTMTLAEAGAKSKARKASTARNYNVAIEFTGADGKIYKVNKTVSLTAYNATNDEDPLDPQDPQSETCTITWMVCGLQYGDVQTVNKGSALVLPATPDAKEGRLFYGWVTDPNYESTSAPTLVEAGTIVSENVTYYAVFK